MKHVGFGIAIFMTIVITLVSIMSIDAKTQRDNEAESALSSSIESSLDSILEDHAYTVNDSDELVADLLQSLLLSVDSDSKLTVNVLDIDEDKGILSVEVIEKFKYQTGQTGSVSCVKTVVVDKPQEEAAKEYVTIKYVYGPSTREGELYKEYHIVIGSPIIVPKNPDCLYGWTLPGSNTYIDPSTFSTDTDRTFVAHCATV